MQNSKILELLKPTSAIALINFKKDFTSNMIIKYGEAATAMAAGVKSTFNLQNGNSEQIKMKNKKKIDDQSEYEKNQKKLVSEIRMAVSEESWERIKNDEGFNHVEDAVDLWKILLKTHQTNGSEKRIQQHQISGELSTLKQKQEQSAEEFFTLLSQKFDIARALDVLPNEHELIGIVLRGIDKKKNRIALEQFSNKTPIIETFAQARDYFISQECNSKTLLFGENLETLKEEDHIIGIATTNVNDQNHNKRQRQIKPTRQWTEKFCKLCHKNQKPESVVSSHNTGDCKVKEKFCEHCSQNKKPAYVVKSHDTINCKNKRTQTKPTEDNNQFFTIGSES